jgi:hypothetical protein
MVEMAMGEQDLRELDAVLVLRLLQALEEAGNVAAGIDEGGLLGGRAPDQRGVLLERRDRNDHGVEGRGHGAHHTCPLPSRGGGC